MQNAKPMKVKQVPNRVLTDLVYRRQEEQETIRRAQADVCALETEIKKAIIASEHYDVLKIDWRLLDSIV